jgi:REP element-mobilizing transposase RayT
MRRNKLALYLHLIWATWDREPLITLEIERQIHRSIASQATNMGCSVLAINGVPDHVHLVVKIPTTITIASLVKQVKGVSSHFVNDMLKPERHFKWQGSYGAFTVSRWDLDKIINYVKHQKEHHRTDELYPEWEQTFEETKDKGD